MSERYDTLVLGGGMAGLPLALRAVPAPGSGASPAAHDDGAPPRALVPDLADVAGQGQARFALEVAAAGGHHLLLSGPPGAGKTVMACALIAERARPTARRTRSAEPRSRSTDTRMCA